MDENDEGCVFGWQNTKTISGSPKVVCGAEQAQSTCIHVYGESSVERLLVHAVVSAKCVVSPDEFHLPVESDKANGTRAVDELGGPLHLSLYECAQSTVGVSVQGEPKRFLG